MRKILLLLMSSAVLGGCASSTLLTKPIEAQGKALALGTTAVGESASNFKTSTRMNLLMGSRATSFGEDEIEFRIFHDISNPQESTYNTAIVNARDSLICYPLAAAQIRQQNSTALAGLGKSLSKVAADSPKTIVGLLGTLDKDYAVAIPGATNTDVKSDALKLVCQNVYKEAISKTTNNDPDYEELYKINYNAFKTGKPTAQTQTIGINTLADTIKIIGSLFTGVTKRIDQSKRNAALKKFYEDPKNTGKIRTEIQGLDQAIRVAELGNRLLIKDAFHAALTKYRLEAQKVNNSARIGSSPELLEAATELLLAANNLDGIILARMSEHLNADDNLLKIYAQTTDDPVVASIYFKKINALEKATGEEKLKIQKVIDTLEKKLGDKKSIYRKKYDAYKLASSQIIGDRQKEVRTSQTATICDGLNNENVTCLKSALGQSLLTTHQHTANVALRKWKHFTTVEKIAYWESVFATAEELKTLNNNFAAFENDKESFVILNDFLDGFKRDP